MIQLLRPLARLCRRTAHAAPLVGVVLLISCHSSPSTVPGPTRLATPAHTEPIVRVRIVKSASAVSVSGAHLTLKAQGSAEHAFAPPIRITPRGTAFQITDARGQSVVWPATTLEAQTPSGFVDVNGTSYPGTIVLQLNASGLDAVNYVPIEQYLPGVLDRELYASWPVEAFVAQAIAARSYALAQLESTRNRHYDLEATTASQVYGGHVRNPKALEAARRTRGEVLTWNGRVLTAYFSASSGGVSQQGAAAFPDKRPGIDIPPLAGRQHGWGQSSPNFTWGPLRRSTSELAQRIAAWGRTNGHPVASLQGLTRVDVAARGASGRPAIFQLVDARGQVHRLAAEQFRFACNADAPGLPQVEPAQQVKSSFLDIAITGGVVTISGRGHGHGVGLDQWAARDMATQGHSGHQIALFFYPGARIKRLY